MEELFSALSPMASSCSAWTQWFAVYWWTDGFNLPCSNLFLARWAQTLRHTLGAAWWCLYGSLRHFQITQATVWCYLVLAQLADLLSEKRKKKIVSTGECSFASTETWLGELKSSCSKSHMWLMVQQPVLRFYDCHLMDWHIQQYYSAKSADSTLFSMVLSHFRSVKYGKVWFTQE